MVQQTGFKLIVPWGKVNAKIKQLELLAPDINRQTRSLTQEALLRLKETTPRSSKSGVHIADQWTADFITLKGFIREVRIHNTPENSLVLMCLEKGTRPHRIPSSGNTVLKFQAGGADIFSANVQHKGSRAFEMVELTRLTLAARISQAMGKAVKNYTKKVERA